MEILYRDDYLVAVNKPSGLLVHRSAIDRRETRFAVQEVRDLIGQRVYPLHRLDKPTAGVLLFALDPDTARAMMVTFQGREVHKHYLAVVRGYTDPCGCIDYPLSEQLDRMTDSRARHDKGPQDAVTDYRRLATVELPEPVGRYPSSRYSLLEANPRTGRKHQIRRHFKHIFHPIVGDTTHGDGRHNDFFRHHFHCHQLLLCAQRLQFPHPAGGATVRIRAPLDATFQRVVNELGWSNAVPGG